MFSGSKLKSPILVFTYNHNAVLNITVYYETIALNLGGSWPSQSHVRKIRKLVVGGWEGGGGVDLKCQNLGLNKGP